MDIAKNELIEEIKHLISVDGSSVDINPNYLQYFDFDELCDIKEQLINRKIDQNEIAKEYLDEVYEKCGVLI